MKVERTNRRSIAFQSAGMSSEKKPHYDRITQGDAFLSFESKKVIDMPPADKVRFNLSSFIKFLEENSCSRYFSDGKMQGRERVRENFTDRRGVIWRSV